MTEVEKRGYQAGQDIVSQLCFTVNNIVENFDAISLLSEDKKTVWLYEKIGDLCVAVQHIVGRNLIKRQAELNGTTIDYDQEMGILMRDEK